MTINHPGVTLLSVLDNEEMSQKELSVRTGVSEKHISTIVNGEKKISTSFARKLNYVFPNVNWLKLQFEYDSEQLRIQQDYGISEEELAVLKPLKEVIQYLISQEYIHNDCSDAEKILQLRTFFGVSNLNSIPQITFGGAYRAQMKNCIADPYVVYAWQRICEKKTEALVVENILDISKLEGSLDELRNMTNLDVSIAVKRVQKILGKCGIAFSIVRNFRGAPVQGFIKQNANKTILCLTIRGKRADSFWFTFFHELGHVIHEDFSKRFIDFDSSSSNIEMRADNFARNLLIPAQKYKHFVLNQDYSKWSAIADFADEIHIPAYIILGRLQSDGLLDWSDFSRNVQYLPDDLVEK